MWGFTGLRGGMASATTTSGTCSHPLVVVDLALDADPPKVLVIGPDRSGRLLEVILLDLADDRMLVIHAMDLRPIFHDLLPPGGDTDE